MLASERGLHLTAAAEVATCETLLHMAKAAHGLLCLGKPAQVNMPTLSSPVTDHFAVGRVEHGRVQSSREAGRRYDHILVPIACNKNGVLAQPGPVECAVDLARLAGMAPCVIIASVSKASTDESASCTVTNAEIENGINVSEMVECRLILQQDWWTTPCKRPKPFSCAYAHMQIALAGSKTGTG
jgi:3,4-dihydroxy-2-butanone 4-phosphate synthase